MKRYRSHAFSKMNGLCLTAIIVLISACGNKKSNTNTISSSAGGGTITGLAKLASCNKVVTAQMSMSSAAVQSQAGAVDPNWIKVKFNTLSAASSTPGNVIRYFKWKLTNGVKSPDSVPLKIYGYDLSSGVATPTATDFIVASTVSPSKGYYVQLNDAQAAYQVLQTVVYSNAGAVIAQAESLIPQFSASPNDYAKNGDGSDRSPSLRALHPLASTATSGWTESRLNDYFQNFCF